MTLRLRLLLALGAMATLLPACGIPYIDVPDLSPQVITKGSKSDIPPFQTDAVFVVVIKTTVTGALEGTVDWTIASNPVAIAWHSGDCTQNHGCAQLSANATTSKPKTVTTANASAGTYSLIVMNLGTTNESISYRITLTP